MSKTAISMIAKRALAGATGGMRAFATTMMTTMTMTTRARGACG